MSEIPHMPLYTSDYLGDTTHLSTEEHGAYFLMLITLWNAGGELPNDPKRLARVVRCTSAKWKKIWPAISDFFDVTEAVISQKRLTFERVKVSEKIAKARENGKRGGRPKTLKKKEQAKANGYPQHNPEKSYPEPEPEISREIGASENIFERCLKSAGLTKQAIVSSPSLVDFTPILNLLSLDQTTPCDLELDALPAIAACAASLASRNQTLSSWRYCRDAIIRNRDSRLAGTPAPVKPAARTHHGPPASGKRQAGGKAAAAMRLADQLRDDARPAGDVYENDPNARYGLEQGRIGYSEPHGSGSTGEDSPMACNSGPFDSLESAERCDGGSGDNVVLTQAERMAG